MSNAPPPTAANAPPNPEPSPPSTPVSWDGDRMFNIYIYDYCTKRGYHRTARELLAEAEIPADSHPPINAKQGLLFEWWSVFWVLFTAKSSGSGTEDALLYTQHQAQQVQRQAQRLPQQQVNRLMNGMPRHGMPTGPMPNGISPPSGPPGAPGAMMNGTQGPLYGGGMPQPNGAAGASSNGAPSGGSVQTPLLSNQRPPGPPQRGPNGAPFQSPTMAHSPQNLGGGPAPQPNPQAGGMGGPVGSSQPLTQMNRGGMLPPNGPQGMGGVPMPGSQQTPQPAFQPLGHSPSQPGSPGQGLTSRSPSMAARQPPVASDIRQLQEANVNKDLFTIDANLLAQVKRDIGLGEKDMLSLTYEDKQRLISVARQRGRLGNKPGVPPNAIPGPSNLAMQHPNQRNPQMGQAPQPGQTPQQQQQQLQQQQQQQQRPVKRSSSSPGQEHEQLSQNGSSPPANKRPRPSPSGPEQQVQPPPMTPMMPYPPQHGPQGGPQQMNGMMGRPMGGAPMHGFPGQAGMPNMGNNGGMGMPLGPSIGAPQMGNPMSPAGMNGPGGVPHGMLQYRHSMHALHKNNIPHGALTNMLPNAASPGSNDQQFSGDGSQQRPGANQFGGPAGAPNNRVVQNKSVGMMPPPSPGMNKNPAQKDGGSTDPGMNNSSPRNAAAAVGQGQNQPQGNQGQGGGTAPPTPIPANTNVSAPSPSAMPNNPPPPMNVNHLGGLPTSDPIFAEFLPFDNMDMDSTGVFRPDGLGDAMGAADFERDFGDWFRNEELGLDSK